MSAYYDDIERLQDRAAALRHIMKHGEYEEQLEAARKLEKLLASESESPEEG